VRQTLATALALLGEQFACDWPVSDSLLAIVDRLSAFG
jgi:hypothetical protein